jgi:hypothetical protein
MHLNQYGALTMSFKRLFFCLALLLGAGRVWTAQADPLVFTPTGPTVFSVTTGTTLSFAGTLTNAGQPTVFISTAPVSGLSGLPNFTVIAGFLNTPLSLAAGESIGPTELFRVSVPLGATPGIYNFTFTVLGGSGPDQFNVLATQTYSMNVEAAPVPEPATLLLLGTGLAGVVGAVRKRSPRR